jgi:hypothetical protein
VITLPFVSLLVPIVQPDQVLHLFRFFSFWLNPKTRRHHYIILIPYEENTLAQSLFVERHNFVIKSGCGGLDELDELDDIFNPSE